VSYTIWMHGKQIGETRFELQPSSRQKVGAFVPTEHGETVVPRITAMLNAVRAFHEVCVSRGIDATRPGPRGIGAAGKAMRNTPEGQKLIDASRAVAEVEVRDECGVTIAWEALSITNLDDLKALVAVDAPAVAAALPDHQAARIHYMISVTVAVRGARNRLAEALRAEAARLC
jgi:hypothetical protein